MSPRGHSLTEPLMMQWLSSPLRLPTNSFICPLGFLVVPRLICPFLSHCHTSCTLSFHHHTPYLRSSGGGEKCMSQSSWHAHHFLSLSPDFNTTTLNNITLLGIFLPSFTHCVLSISRHLIVGVSCSGFLFFPL